MTIMWRCAGADVRNVAPLASLARRCSATTQHQQLQALRTTPETHLYTHHNPTTSIIPNQSKQSHTPYQSACFSTKIPRPYVLDLRISPIHPTDKHQLINNCIANFNIAPDRASLSRISNSLSTLGSARSHILTTHRSALKQLTRQLNTATSQLALSTQSHNPSTHAAHILALDTDKFRIAKEASELEIEGERLEAEIGAAREALAVVDEEGPEGGDAARAAMVGGGEDEVLLKLKVYRMMGIEVLPDERTGLFEKAVVRNRDKGDVHVVNIDPKFSRFFYANYFWNTV